MKIGVGSNTPVQYFCERFYEIVKASKFTNQTNFVQRQLFDKLAAFSENVCHLLSDLKHSKSEGKSKRDELLEIVNSAETIQMLEEVQGRLFDDENEQFINPKFIAPEDIEADKIQICEILQSIEKDFYLALSQKALPGCKEILGKIEAYLNSLKNGTKTVNKILLWVCTQIIEILKQKIFTKWSTVEPNLTELNFVDRRNSLEQTINHVKIDLKNDGKKRAAQKKYYTNRSNESTQAKTIFSLQMLFENERVRRVRRFNHHFFLPYLPALFFLVLFLMSKSYSSASVIFVILLYAITACGFIFGQQLQQEHQQFALDEVVMPHVDVHHLLEQSRRVQHLLARSTRPFNIQTDTDQNLSSNRYF